MLDNIPERKRLLAEYLGINPKEIQVTSPRWHDWDTEFRTPLGTFWVLNEDEAKEATYADIENCMDDLGLDSFTEGFVDWILDNAVDDDWFDTCCKEDYENYAADIEGEEDRTGRGYENRLVEECVSNGLISERDIVDGKYTGKEDLQELLANYLYEDAGNNYGSYAKWYLREFGAKEFNYLIKQGIISIDMDAIVDECIEEDGKAHFIARYDGKEVELDGYYAYKQEDYDERDAFYDDDWYDDLFD